MGTGRLLWSVSGVVEVVSAFVELESGGPLAVGTGLQAMAAMFAQDAERLCGPAGKHNPGRVGIPAWQRGRSRWAGGGLR